MCGRYALYDMTTINFKGKITPNYNICPGEKVLLLNEKSLFFYHKWSIIPIWNKKIHLINVRLETLKTRSTFKNYKRCIFLANGYFEWKKENKKKTPYYHTLEKNILYFAGIYNSDGAVIVTTENPSNQLYIHHRQPVLLKRHECFDWINRKINQRFELNQKIKKYEVSQLVNKPINKNRNNIIPV